MNKAESRIVWVIYLIETAKDEKKIRQNAENGLNALLVRIRINGIR